MFACSLTDIPCPIALPLRTLRKITTLGSIPTCLSPSAPQGKHGIQPICGTLATWSPGCLSYRRSLVAPWSSCFSSFPFTTAPLSDPFSSNLQAFPTPPYFLTDNLTCYFSKIKKQGIDSLCLTTLPANFLLVKREELLLFLPEASAALFCLLSLTATSCSVAPTCPLGCFPSAFKLHLVLLSFKKQTVPWVYSLSHPSTLFPVDHSQIS